MALDARCHAVNEVIQLLCKLFVIAKCISSLTDEVLCIVAGDSVNTSVVVCLRLDIDHTVRCLQTNFELFSVKQIWLTTLFRERLQIICTLTGLLVDELTIVIVTELAALHSNARLNQRSKYSKATL